MDEGAGRGRGRGRGGVPVLPEGMWDALQGNSEKQSSNAASAESFLDALPPSESGQYEDSNNRAVAPIPMGFGRGRGDFGGRGGRGGRGRGGGGLERDVKGKDWECPSCTNVNWSWRSNCNKCNTAKPAAILTEAENRDGAGKGFNERQERISASTVEIDEEGFDDFGRRVKKEQLLASSRADRRAKEEAALARMNEKYKHLIPQAVVQPVGADLGDGGAGARSESGSGSLGATADNQRSANNSSRDGAPSDSRGKNSDNRAEASRNNNNNNNGSSREADRVRTGDNSQRDDRTGRDDHHRGSRTADSRAESRTEPPPPRRREDSRDRDRKRPRSPDNTHSRGGAERDRDSDRDRGERDRVVAAGDRGRDTERGRADRDERGGGGGRSYTAERDRGGRVDSRDGRDSRDKYSRRD